ncbi:carbohydrate kinase [Paenibacillaceae bacterium]|nr:carbohydrate kinase [Paenibacillaceae bacterium]
MQVTALGEVLIDFTPAGSSAAGNVQFEQNPGGAPANVLAALAKLGVETAFIGKVGSDQFGRYLLDTLTGCGIDASGVVLDAEANTTLAFVHLAADGDRTFSFYRNPGADQLLKPEEVNTALIENSKVFHFGSISMTHQPAADATRRALQAAKAGGQLVSFDPNLRPALWDDLERAKEIIREGLAASDIVKLSEEELVFLTDDEQLDRAARRVASEYNIQLLLVTLGEKGCYYLLGDTAGSVPSYKVKAVDTTGAGDSFLGGFLYKLLEDGRALTLWSEEELAAALSFACAMAALVTTKKGAIPAMPSKEEIEALLGS